MRKERGRRSEAIAQRWLDSVSLVKKYGHGAGEYKGKISRF